MGIRRALMIAVAAVFALSVNCYLIVHSLLSKADTGTKLASGECPDPTAQASSQTNPNKVLFVSCGGFID